MCFIGFPHLAKNQTGKERGTWSVTFQIHLLTCHWCRWSQLKVMHIIFYSKARHFFRMQWIRFAKRFMLFIYWGSLKSCSFHPARWVPWAKKGLLTDHLQICLSEKSQMPKGFSDQYITILFYGYCAPWRTIWDLLGCTAQGDSNRHFQSFAQNSETSRGAK